jgi:SAM-dependent methyltransferase
MIPEPSSTGYDLTRFQGNAPYYARYVTYPDALFTRLEQVRALNGQGRLLDLGCGTGQLTIPLARLFEGATGVDLEPEMIQEAERVTREAGIRNIQYICGAAEDLPRSLGSFRLVTIGVACHWMDRARVLDVLYDMLDNDGAVAIVSHAGKEKAWSGPNPWPTVDGILDRYLDFSGKSGANLTGGGHVGIIQRSRLGGRGCDEFRVSYERDWTVDQPIGFVYTKSYCARWRFGDYADRFEHKVRESLYPLEPTGQFRGQGEIQVHRRGT